jgi:hypothetical protein
MEEQHTYISSSKRSSHYPAYCVDDIKMLLTMSPGGLFKA